MATLFEECIDALSNNVKLLSLEETEHLFDAITKAFPMLVSGHIDWTKVSNKRKFESFATCVQSIKDKNSRVYIFWDMADIPGLETDLASVVTTIDDVTAVGFYTWIYNVQDGYVIECSPGGAIHIGWTQK